MGMRGLRCAFGVCGAALLLAIAALAASAAPENSSSEASAKAGPPPALHRGASRAHPKTVRPAPRKTTTNKERKKDLAVRPAAASPARPADKSLDQRALFGPFSFDVATEPKVKRRSIRGGEYDPDRDGDQTKGFRPPFLGLSLKSEFSW
jgi:septal ring-binding cell division protein DamX